MSGEKDIQAPIDSDADGTVSLAELRQFNGSSKFANLRLQGISGAQIRFPEYLNLFGSYKAAILLHNTAGILVAISFSFWFFYYTCVARKMTQIYVPNREDLQHGLVRQAIYYFFLRETRKGREIPSFSLFVQI